MRPPEVDMDPLLSHVKIINDGLTLTCSWPASSMPPKRTRWREIFGR
jgi:hypothetical protein